MGFEVSSPASAAGSPAGELLRSDPFVLESRGWSSASVDCAPKLSALASLANLAPPDPVASVSYRSRGNALVIGTGRSQGARDCAALLAESLHVTLLAEARVTSVPYASWSGRVVAVAGFLGEFEATLTDLSTDGGPAKASPAPAKFDLILDFSETPVFDMRQPPQGYWHASADPAKLSAILEEMRDAVGEFEKPRYFAYRENICAHSRSAKVGCNACIDICSTRAIAPDGDHVKVDPHLCMGCGACATVCPSGAMSYQYPRVGDRGAQLKQLLNVYREAGGSDAVVVFHDGQRGRDLLVEAAEQGAGLPARALPLESWHVAAVGLDLLLPAIAYGASQVAIVADIAEDREYVAALREQMAIGETILHALGYGGTHFAVMQAASGAELEAAFASAPRGSAPAVPGTFLLSNDKRTAIEFAIEHLVKHAPLKVDQIQLPVGAPFGEVRVAKDKCTMCMACVGSCPESALMDGVDQPLLKFLERNCVQCGLCETTCPEDAITLSPRLLLTPAVREARVLNETQPFHCVSCGKAFGTRQMVETMLGRLSGHSMFTGGEALRRLQMCADCRVVDMMANKNEVSVLRMGADS